MTSGVSVKKIADLTGREFAMLLYVGSLLGSSKDISEAQLMEAAIHYADKVCKLFQAHLDSGEITP